MPLTGEVLAIIRQVELGPRRDLYYRAVTANPDPSMRQLIGYWGSPQDAHDGTLALYEQKTGRSVHGGNLPPSMTPVPMKPPPSADPNRPGEHERGMAARPRQHGARA